MEDFFKYIKVKALAWIEDGASIFVVTMPDSVKGDLYYRPIGGSVEYGKTGKQAVKREFMEELKAEIEVTGEPLILENLFTCDGKFGHEIDLIFPAKLVDKAFYERKTFPLVEANGEEFQAMWITMADCLSGKLRLVPEPLLDWCKGKNSSNPD
jgi:8-oxo-dGTP pyrophosphatase MutT (NUDIX family)